VAASSVVALVVASVFKVSNDDERLATALFSELLILLILLANWAKVSATAEEAPGTVLTVAGIS